MSSSRSMLERFDQTEYDYVFYECDDNHAFIAFTTCYCPMCDLRMDKSEVDAELEIAETSLDRSMELYEDLIVKVTKHAPELLI